MTHLLATSRNPRLCNKRAARNAHSRALSAPLHFQRALFGTFFCAAVVVGFTEPGWSQSSGDFGMFRSSIGFDKDRRHMIDPIGGNRDESGNLVVSGGISSDISSKSACGLSAAAVGNFLSVVVDGNNNTVIVTANQNNSGAISASNVLNGKIQFPC